jgi:hypothetical protein
MKPGWYRALAWVSTLILVQLAISFAFRPRTEVIGAGLLPARDDVNGFLCYIGENNCFAYTATAGPMVTAPASPTATPTHTATSAPTATPTPTALASATQTMTATQTPYPTNTRVPSPTATLVQVVLNNGGFEQVVNGNPAGWTRWTEAGGPEWNSELSPPGDALAVHSGSASVRFIAHHVCWRYGIYQTLPAPAGRNVTVSAWFLTLGNDITGLRNADPNMNSEIGIGVDKYGMTDPLGADVSWKFAKGENLVGPLIGGNYEPVWTQMSSTVRVPADSQLITVFLSLDLGRTREGKCNWALPQTLGFVDDATVEILP